MGIVQSSSGRAAAHGSIAANIQKIIDSSAGPQTASWRSTPKVDGAAFSSKANHPDYLRGVHALRYCYGMLIILSVVTFMVRSWAYRYKGLPLECAHVSFLALVLVLSSIRIFSFSPSKDGSGLDEMIDLRPGHWVDNFVGTLPMVIIFTMYTLLNYHVAVVLRAIHVTYNMAFTETEQSLTLASSALARSAENAGDTHNCTAAQRSTIRQGSVTQGCWPCRFWCMHRGKPYNTWLVFVVVTNVIMWTGFTALMLVLACTENEPPGAEMLFTVLLFAPCVGVSVMLGASFMVCGVLLLCRLRDLRQLRTRWGSGMQSWARPSMEGRGLSHSPSASPPAAAAGVPGLPEPPAIRRGSSFGEAASPVSALPVSALPSRSPVAGRVPSGSSVRFGSSPPLAGGALRRNAQDGIADCEVAPYAGSTLRLGSSPPLSGGLRRPTASSWAAAEVGSFAATMPVTQEVVAESDGVSTSPAISGPSRRPASLSATTSSREARDRDLQDSDGLGDWCAVISPAGPGPGKLPSLQSSPLLLPQRAQGNVKDGSGTPAEAASGTLRESATSMLLRPEPMGGQSGSYMEVGSVRSSWVMPWQRSWENSPLYMSAVASGRGLEHLTPLLIDPVLTGVRRMLIVITVSFFAFLFRACALIVVAVWFQKQWPGFFLVVYMCIAEVLPSALLLIMYCIPGLPATCRCPPTVSVVDDSGIPSPRISVDVAPASRPGAVEAQLDSEQESLDWQTEPS